MAGYWDKRTLCPDGNCIGVIGDDGKCTECGRKPDEHYENGDEFINDPDWESRTLCSDESCIGVVGPNGFCKECGKHCSYSPEDEYDDYYYEAEDEGIDWSKRILCQDGSCIGVLDKHGKCNECGKVFDIESCHDGEFEPGVRTFCSDESCIGVIGSDGLCNECGKPYFDSDVEDESDYLDLEERILCDDESCIGVIGIDGKCKECGLISSKYEEIKTKLAHSYDEDNPNSGYIYIMTNSAMKKNFLKIGKTKRNPKRRVSELSQGTGVPVPFQLRYKIHFENCDIAEKLIHKRLGFSRVRKRREFFELPIEKAIKVIKEVKLKVT